MPMRFQVSRVNLIKRFDANILLVLLFLFSDSAFSDYNSSEICFALDKCINDNSVCILLQDVTGSRNVIHSEAYQDMEYQVDSLKKNIDNIVFFQLRKDASKFFNEIKPSSAIRTIFLTKNGVALVYDGIYVDDFSPIINYFSHNELSENLRPYIMEVKLTYKKGVCIQ